MWNFIDKLREKNDAQKIVISFAVALLITFVITATWLTAIFATRDKSDSQVEENQKPQSSEEVTPVSNLGGQIQEVKSMFGELLTQFNFTKDAIQAIPEVSEEPETLEVVATTTVNSTTTIEIEGSNSTTTLEIESSSE